jgi:hypothetical protein
MTLLKDSHRKKQVQALSVTLWTELQDVDENYAESFLDWCITKLRVNKHHQEEQKIKAALRRPELSDEERIELSNRLSKLRHKNHPRNITKGDIVHVRFGVNLGDELSDLDRNFKPLPGHYGIVIAQRGFMFLVLPLTSQPQRLNDPELEFYFENLGLPGGHTKSYPAFAKMQFVHIRRITRINGVDGGKKSLTQPQIELLNSKFEKLMQLKNVGENPIVVT